MECNLLTIDLNQVWTNNTQVTVGWCRAGSAPLGLTGVQPGLDHHAGRGGEEEDGHSHSSRSHTRNRIAGSVRVVVFCVACWEKQS